jgi:replicative DNA helicase
MDRIEPIILRSLIYNDEYVRQVIPFLQPEYFLDKNEREIFVHTSKFIQQYNVSPTPEALLIDMDQSGVDGDRIDEIREYLCDIESIKDVDTPIEWLIEKSDAWTKDQAIHNALMASISILNGTDKTRDKGIIPKLLQDALGTSFDQHVGHDYFDDADARYDFYKKKDSRIKFHLDYFNRITKNGVPNKTLNICLAGTNVGKSLFMCDLASAYMMQGKNVVYITLEMAEERIAERIDANLMNIPLDDLSMITKDGFQKNIDRINKRTGGKLFIKEFPTASAHVGHFRHYLNELWLKKGVKPHAIFIDYLNICASSRMKMTENGYTYIKAIAEELRGLAVEFNVPIWSATQMNRAGFANSDPDLTNTSESFGLPATADFMFAMVTTDELMGMNQILVKILKNRYGSKHTKNKTTGKIMQKFIVGVDYSKQKLYDIDQSGQDISDDAGGIAPPSGMGAASATALGAANSFLEALSDDDGLPTADPNLAVNDLPTGEREFRAAEEQRQTNAKPDTESYQPKGFGTSVFSRKKHNIKV